MIRILLKKQLLELFRTYVVDNKTGKARSKGKVVAFSLLFVLLFICLGFAFFGFAMTLGEGILNNGHNWLYFALMGLLSYALGIFGSVFSTYASLYLPKDNEFLMSLPIPNRDIIMARTASVYLMGLMYSAWLWLPTLIAYWITVPINALNVIFPLLLTFVNALFVSVLTCLLGWVVALIATKVKGKSILTVILSLIFLTVYYVVYTKIIQSLNEVLAHLDVIESAVKNWMHYLCWMGEAADGNPLSMLLVVAITAVLGAVCLFALTKTFTGLVTAGNQTNEKSKKVQGYPVASPKRALLKREFKHFTSVSTWMLNCGLGIVLIPALAVFAAVKRDAVLVTVQSAASELPWVVNAVPVILLIVLSYMLSLDGITAPSVSLEGQSLWVVQTLPIDPWDVLQAKEEMALILNAVPALLAVLTVGIAYGLPVWAILLVAVGAVLYILMNADLGLILDLKHANLKWTNVVVPVKQSVPVTVLVFGGWGISLVLGGIGIGLSMFAPGYVPLLVFIVLLGTAWALERRWLRKKGVVVLARLSA